VNAHDGCMLCNVTCFVTSLLQCSCLHCYHRICSTSRDYHSV